MTIDISFLPALAAAYLMIFARIGTMLMLLPGLGEMLVPVRVRLTAALVLAALMLPLHRAAYQVDLGALGPVLILFGEELLYIDRSDPRIQQSIFIAVRVIGITLILQSRFDIVPGQLGAVKSIIQRISQASLRKKTIILRRGCQAPAYQGKSKVNSITASFKIIYKY